MVKKMVKIVEIVKIVKVCQICASRTQSKRQATRHKLQAQTTNSSGQSINRLASLFAGCVWPALGRLRCTAKGWLAGLLANENGGAKIKDEHCVRATPPERVSFCCLFLAPIGNCEELPAGANSCQSRAGQLLAQLKRTKQTLAPLGRELDHTAPAKEKTGRQVITLVSLLRPLASSRSTWSESVVSA